MYVGVSSVGGCACSVGVVVAVENTVVGGESGCNGAKVDDIWSVQEGGLMGASGPYWFLKRRQKGIFDGRLRASWSWEASMAVVDPPLSALSVVLGP